jgi:hypothetical protein
MFSQQLSIEMKSDLLTYQLRRQKRVQTDLLLSCHLILLFLFFVDFGFGRHFRFRRLRRFRIFREELRIRIREKTATKTKLVSEKVSA